MDFLQWDQASLAAVVMLVVGYSSQDTYFRDLAKQLLRDFTLWLRDKDHKIFSFDEVSLIYNKVISCPPIDNRDDLSDAFHYLNCVCIEIRQMQSNTAGAGANANIKFHNVLTISDCCQNSDKVSILHQTAC